MPNKRDISETTDRPNFLFIAVDDLNDWIGCLGGHPQVRTPNIDRLAQRGLVFANTSCPAPICTPARTAVLTGIHPANSGLYFLQPWRFREVTALRDVVTLPQYMGQQGYHTMAAGKVFHGENDPASFSEIAQLDTSGWKPDHPVSYAEKGPLWDWGMVEAGSGPTPDEAVANWAIDRLQHEYDAPFFMGIGFVHPHVPMYASPEWFDLYPPGQTILPDPGDEAMGGIGQFALQLTYSSPAPRHEDVVQRGLWEYAVRSYLATISYMDAQLGRVLEALDASVHAANTIIVFWADHGFHLGEKQRWAKRSLWEESARAPMIFAGPGVQPGQTDLSTGTIDLYPTLVDLAGLPMPDGLDGHSLVPLLQGRTDHWRDATICTFGPGNHGVRSRHWRYIHYADGSEELYDHTQDPDEHHNLAGQPKYAEVIARHREWLPAEDAPLVPGSGGSGSPLYRQAEAGQSA